MCKYLEVIVNFNRQKCGFLVLPILGAFLKSRGILLKYIILMLLYCTHSTCLKESVVTVLDWGQQYYKARYWQNGVRGTVK